MNNCKRTCLDFCSLLASPFPSRVYTTSVAEKRREKNQCPHLPTSPFFISPQPTISPLIPPTLPYPPLTHPPPSSFLSLSLLYYLQPNPQGFNFHGPQLVNNLLNPAE
ncbi:hypothetical protein Dimus_006688 [Dionaea muscipula]